jgi:hypothetical protein
MFNFSQFLCENKSTLEYHDSLNPLLWKNEKFDAAARKRLLKLAEFWREYALIPEDAVEDILLVGGNANYNYTKYSDLDLHLFVDKNKIPDCKEEILDEYLKDKKTLWGLTHQITIYGIPVEIYAQGKDEGYSTNQGVFSLKNNEWIKKPNRVQVNLKDSVLRKKVSSLKHHIEYYINHNVDNINSLKNLQDRIKNMRQSGIKRGGEFSLENLVFKELRNQGLIDKFHSYVIGVEDKSFTLKKKVNHERK